MSNVIVVGGGAAGMMAAVSAAENGHEVTLIEKNEKLGKKLYITGKGRCNVTNAADVETLLSNVISNKKFLYSAFYSFDNTALMDMIEGAGCPLKTERGDRVFPVSDHSSDIIKAFEKLLNKNGVTIKLNTTVKEVVTDGGEVIGVKVLKKNPNNTASKVTLFKADAVIVCTGGVSYPLTGSTGDGYRFAEKCGHTLVSPHPSLVPFETAETWPSSCMGLSLKNVSLKLVCGKKTVYDGFGEMLFTHFGISGPLVLSASAYYDSAKHKDCKAIIDLKPALSEEQLDKRILRDFEENINKSFINAISGLLPSALIPVIADESKIDREKKVHDITKEERKNLLYALKNLTLNIAGTRGFDEAIITRGGISVKDIDPGTMESKFVKGLYFAGEVLDLDALTGGFNLQIAWSTGHAAGSSVL
ncbi:MAG: NAD(P)/FAD-dependent oxidoreductase [Lachnospiraceae bacterium]|nr:NAD(P)/FAD-dependent oxidoreductase [Lachnospiraceae bacterium]